jgi:hypothetical protein
VNFTALLSRFQKTWVSVGPDAVLLGRELHHEIQTLAPDLPFHGRDRVLDDLPGVDVPAVQLELAARDARQVEQIVDQPRLQLDVALDHGKLARVAGEVGIGFEARDDGEHRRQRRAQLVAQGGEEAVLGLVGGLGLLMGPLQLLLHARAVGDVDRAAHHPHRPPLGIADDEPLVPDVDVAAVTVAQPELDAEGGAASLDGAEDLAVHTLDILGVDLLLPPAEPGLHLLRPVAQQPEQALRPLDGLRLDRPVVDQAADRLGRQPEPLLALAQGLLGALHLRDVRRNAADQPAAHLVVDRELVDQEVADAAVRPGSGLHGFQRAAGLRDGPDVVVDRLGVDGREQLEDRLAEGGIALDSEDAGVRLAQEEEAALLVGDPRAEGAVVEEGLEALLAAAQGLGGHLGLGEQVVLAGGGGAVGAGRAEAGRHPDGQRARGERLQQEVAGSRFHAVQTEPLARRLADQDYRQVPGVRIALELSEKIEAALLHPRQHRVGPARAPEGGSRHQGRRFLDIANL